MQKVEKTDKTAVEMLQSDWLSHYNYPRVAAFVRVQIIAVVQPLQFSAKRSRITAQHVPRDRELTQVNLFIRALV